MSGTMVEEVARRSPEERGLAKLDMRALREATGLQQKEFGALLGKDKQTAYRWEHTARPDGLPPPDYAVTVALLLAEIPDRERPEVIETIMASPGPSQAMMLLATMLPGDRRTRAVTVGRIAAKVARLRARS